MKRGKWIGNGGTGLAVTLLSSLRVPMGQMMFGLTALWAGSSAWVEAS